MGIKAASKNKDKLSNKNTAAKKALKKKVKLEKRKKKVKEDVKLRPAWLFETHGDGFHLDWNGPVESATRRSRKEVKVARKFLEERECKTPTKALPPTQLLYFIGKFLNVYQFGCTEQAFRLDLQVKKKVYRLDSQSVETVPTQDMVQVFQTWWNNTAQGITGTGMVKPEQVDHSKPSKTDGSSSGDAESGKRVTTMKAPKVKSKERRKSQSSSSSAASSISSSDEDSDSGVLVSTKAHPQPKPSKKPKARRSSSGSSSSSSRASSTSDSDADDEEEAVTLPKQSVVGGPSQKSGKKLKRNIDMSTSKTSEPDASLPLAKKAKSGAISPHKVTDPKSATPQQPQLDRQNSTDSSNTINGVVAPVDSPAVTKVKELMAPNSLKSKPAYSDTSTSDESSVESSEICAPSASSSSDSDNSASNSPSTNKSPDIAPAPAPASSDSDSDTSTDSTSSSDEKLIETAPAPSSKTTTTTKRKRSATPELEDNKVPKKNTTPFSRIPKDTKVDPKLASNAYVPYDYAERAHQDLIVTRGKGFTKEKNKKKRGSYRGGAIDTSGGKGIKFED